MSRDGVAVRACRALVRLYPRRFRDDYGVDMVLLVREQAREEPAWRVLGRLVIDGAISIPSQHLEVRMRRVPSSLVPVVYLTIAAAGLLRLDYKNAARVLLRDRLKHASPNSAHAAATSPADGYFWRR